MAYDFDIFLFGFLSRNEKKNVNPFWPANPTIPTVLGKPEMFEPVSEGSMDLPT